MENEIIESKNTEAGLVQLDRTAAPVMAITVDDGTVRVPIVNNSGQEIGHFTFRPTDLGIIDRYNEMVGRFDEVTKPLESISISETGEANANDEEAIKALSEAKKRLFELCDYMFGGNMSEAFFGTMHPFSPVNGGFYCENAIEAIGKFISAQFDGETVKFNRRMKKYMPVGNRESRRRS